MEPLIDTRDPISPRRLVGFALTSAVAFIAGNSMQIFALFTDFWCEEIYMGLEMNYGLFKVCLNQTCVPWSDFGHFKDTEMDAIRGCEALSILGAIFAMFALVASFCNTCIILQEGRLRPEAGNFAAHSGSFGASCIFICVLVWYAQIRGSSDTISYSFILSVVSGFLVLVGACLDYTKTRGR